MAEKLDLPSLSFSDEMFLGELAPEIDRLHNEHVTTKKEFYPYDFADEMDEAIRVGDFVPEEAPLPPELIDCLIVNLLTEEGLPQYTSTLLRGLPRKHAFRDWINRWTAEEGRHAPAIANWLHRTRQVNMHELERSRMAMMINPDTPQPESFIEGIVYPSIQEPATEISHRNAQRRLPASHKIGKRAIGSVVGDEVKHGIFYRELTISALHINPSLVVVGIARQIRDFAMPGKSIPGFEEKKKVIEESGFFGLSQLKEILDDLIHNRWKIDKVEGLDEQGEKAREFIFQRLGLMGKVLSKRSRQVAIAN